MLQTALHKALYTCTLLLALLTPAAQAQVPSLTNKQSLTTGTRPIIDKPLPVDEAFFFSVRPSNQGKNLILHWDIRSGYYLYQKSIRLEDSSGSASEIPTALPEADSMTDEFFGETLVYRDQLTLQIPISAFSQQADILHLSVRYQGCAEDLYCYPPKQQQLSIPTP